MSHVASPGSAGAPVRRKYPDTHARGARANPGRADPDRTLCTLALDPEGYPYGSFVTVAFDDGNPTFLISGLAEHTKNLEQDPRASLLVAEGGSADPLANGRVTMLRPCTRVGEDSGSAPAAFFAAHPNSTYYAAFRDFGFWKLDVNSVRYIGGYGRMSWISKADWQGAEPDHSVHRPPVCAIFGKYGHPSAASSRCRAGGGFSCDVATFQPGWNRLLTVSEPSGSLLTRRAQSGDSTILSTLPRNRRDRQVQDTAACVESADPLNRTLCVQFRARLGNERAVSMTGLL